jgi:hypothetical protein
MNARRFRLYPDQQHWWSFEDYGFVVSTVENLKAKSVLEFGPGSSTLALIEGGAQRIISCEDDPGWATVYRERLQNRFPAHVRIEPFIWSESIYIRAVERSTFDLALVDGPARTSKRGAVVDYCLRRCRSVLVPLECASGDETMREACMKLAQKYGRPLEVTETGPLAGAFALIGRL